MKFGSLAIFVPDLWLPVILMGAGLAWIVGARKTARTMAIFTILSLILPPILAPLLQMVPTWALWLLALYVVLLVPFAAVSVLQALVAPALGQRTASEAAGRWAADIGRVMFTAPFKLVGALIRMITNHHGK